MTFIRIFAVSLMAGLTAGCSQVGADARAEPAAASAVSAAAVTKIRTQMALAIRRKDFFSPAGNNVFELNLAMLATDPENASTRQALAELEPYLVNAASESLRRGDIGEAQRLASLLRAANPQSTALARLQTDISGPLQAGSPPVPSSRNGRYRPAMP